MRGLILTADDFGAAVAVNEAVEIAHRDGVLTAASLMVGGAAAADAVARARRLPGLRVGLHLVLVEGRPMLPPSEIPDLIEARGGGGGRLRTDMARLGAAAFLRPRVRDQLAREIDAQFRSFRETGLALDHVNAHKHFHLHPTVAGLVLAIGRGYGLRALRVPSEPRAVLALAEGSARLAPTLATAPWAALLRRKAEGAGIAAARQTFGVAWSGRMTESRAAALVRHLPHGVSEIYFHPATRTDFAGAAPGYRYDAELAALTSPALRDAVTSAGLRVGGFADVIPG